jgi:hypothetical protein
MDDFTNEILASAEDIAAVEDSRQASQEHDEQQQQQQAQKNGWGGLRDRTSIQDRLVDRYGILPLGP